MHIIITKRPLFSEPPQRINKNIFSRRGLKQSSMFGGTGYIAGTGAGIVTVNGIPARRRLILFERTTLFPIRGVWSNDDGTYILPHIDPNRMYLLIALDHMGEYEPVAYDFVRPKVDSG